MNSISIPCARLELLKVKVRLAEHPDWERELEIRIRDGTRLIEDTLDRFLSPRTVLYAQTHPGPVNVRFYLFIYRAEGTHGFLAAHDKLHAALDRVCVRVLRVHQGEHRPAGLNNLAILMLDPCTLFARLYTERKAVSTLSPSKAP